MNQRQPAGTNYPTPTSPPEGSAALDWLRGLSDVDFTAVERLRDIRERLLAAESRRELETELTPLRFEYAQIELQLTELGNEMTQMQQELTMLQQQG